MRRIRIRPKTVRRLLILAAAAATASAAVTVAYLVRQHARDAGVAESRALGMSAYDAGNFAAAMPALHEYLNTHPDDVDALFAMANSRASLDPQNRGALADARTRLQQLLVIKPDHPAARRKLLELNEQTGMSREMLDLADGLLRETPNEPAPLRARALALSRLDRNIEALPAWRAYVAAAPNDVRGQMQLLAAMRRAGATPDALVAHAQQLADANAGDARFTLPLAEVLREADREAEALALLRKLAADPPRDEAMLVELVGALDRARAFDDAERLLTRSADALGSGAVTTALVQRIWQTGRYAQLIELTDRILATGRRDSGVLALRALAFAATGRRSEADTLTAELATRRQEAEALAWTDALGIEFATIAPTPTQRVKALRSAAARDPENGIIRVWLGRALMSVGEVDQAAVAYREAAQRMPSWVTPCIELAEAMRGMNRLPDAIMAAKAALLRSPNAAAAQVTAARVRFASIQAKPDAAEEAALLIFVGELRKRLPDEPTLTPMQVSLLARCGRIEEATALLQSAMIATTSASMLTELYTVDRRHNLGVDDAIITRATASNLLTPDLVLRRATDLIADGERLAAIELAQTQADLHAGDAAWALANARVRSRAGDSAAGDAWARLVSGHANNVAVLCAAIDEDAPLPGGRGARADLIQRLKILGGDDEASAWRARYARFLGGSSEMADVRQALTLATDLVRQQPGRPELRVLLAGVLLKLDGTTTALEHLRAANEQSPGDPAIGLALVDLLRREGRLAEAVPVLRRIATFDVSGTAGAADMRMRVAHALLDAGLPEAAAEMLGRAARQHALDPAGQLAYAEALRVTGDGAAAAAFKAIVDEPNASPAGLAAAAAFERSAGRSADGLLARIAALPASADRDRALARYHAGFSEIDPARAAYAAALPAATDASLASEAIAFELGQNDLPRADAILKSAEARFPNDAALRRTRLELSVRQGSGSPAADETLARLITDLSADPSAKAEVDALQALRNARDAKATPALAGALGRLADRYPSSLEVATLAINANLDAGQTDAAVGLTHRMLASHPTQATAFAVAARTFARCDQLPAARRAAEQWRAMTPSAAREADATLAAIALAGGDATRAVALLTPYRAAIDPAQDEAIASTLARALGQQGQPSAAYTLLTPALRERASIRGAWLAVTLDPTDARADAIHRLQELDAATPPTAVDERLRLGNACLSLASRGVDGAAQQGLAAVEPLTKLSELPLVARILHGELLRTSGDLKSAEAVLREAVKVAPDDAAVKNSLAYVILASHPNRARADEASRLASEAAAVFPRQADLRDTLARAEWAAGRTDQAARAFREALRIDPTCLDAMVGLAALHAASGRTADATAMLPTIENRIGRSQLPVHLRAEMRTLRDALSAARD